MSQSLTADGITSCRMRWIFIDKFTNEDKDYLAHKLGWSKRQAYRKFKDCGKISSQDLLQIQEVFSEYGYNLTIDEMLETI